MNLARDLKETVASIEGLIDTTHELLGEIPGYFADYSTVTRVLEHKGMSIGVRPNGILVDLKPERILYDHYPRVFLETYCKLAKCVRRELGGEVLDFSLRTLGVLGITQPAIVFMGRKGDLKVKRYVLLLFLSGMLALYPKQEYVQQFLRLKSQERHLLTEEDEIRLMAVHRQRIEAHATFSSQETALSAHITNLENNLFKKLKVDKDPIFQDTDIQALRRYFSSLLHGSHVALQESLDLVSRDRHILRRSYWLLLCNMYICKSSTHHIGNVELQARFEEISHAWTGLRPKVALVFRKYH